MLITHDTRKIISDLKTGKLWDSQCFRKRRMLTYFPLYIIKNSEIFIWTQFRRNLDESFSKSFHIFNHMAVIRSPTGLSNPCCHPSKTSFFREKEIQNENRKFQATIETSHHYRDESPMNLWQQQFNVSFVDSWKGFEGLLSSSVERIFIFVFPSL